MHSKRFRKTSINLQDKRRGLWVPHWRAPCHICHTSLCSRDEAREIVPQTYPTRHLFLTHVSSLLANISLLLLFALWQGIQPKDLFEISVDFEEVMAHIEAAPNTFWYVSFTNPNKEKRQMRGSTSWLKLLHHKCYLEFLPFKLSFHHILPLNLTFLRLCQEPR